MCVCVCVCVNMSVYVYVCVCVCVCGPIIDKTELNLGFGERGKNRQRHHQEQITDGTHTICSTHQQLHIWKTWKQYAKYNVPYSHGYKNWW